MTEQKKQDASTDEAMLNDIKQGVLKEVSTALTPEEGAEGHVIHVTPDRHVFIATGRHADKLLDLVHSKDKSRCDPWCHTSLSAKEVQDEDES